MAPKNSLNNLIKLKNKKIYKVLTKKMRPKIA